MPALQGFKAREVTVCITKMADSLSANFTANGVS